MKAAATIAAYADDLIRIAHGRTVQELHTHLPRTPSPAPGQGSLRD